MPVTHQKTLPGRYILLLSSSLWCGCWPTYSQAQTNLPPLNITHGTTGISFSESQTGFPNRPAAPFQLYVSQNEPSPAVQAIEVEPVVPAPSQNESGMLRLQPLLVPNISIENFGTGSIPDDKTLGRLPAVQPLPIGPDREGLWYPQHKHWAPLAICHHPLYFQDTMLERHGQERFPCLQPYASGVRFLGTLPLLPYLMTLHPPRENLYNLGHYRPGTAAPLLKERPPYDKHAMRVELLTTAAVVVAVP